MFELLKRNMKRSMQTVILLLQIAFEAQGKLQAWHRKDCFLVTNLSGPLSRLVAEHYNLSAHYVEAMGNPQNEPPILRIILRKLVFRNKTDEQAIAVMKFLNRRGERQYFIVLLENCTVGPQGDKTRFSFEVNTTYASLENNYDYLSDAIDAATLFERSGNWAEPNSGAAEVTPKTNTPKRIRQGIAWSIYVAALPFSVFLTGVGCILWGLGGFYREKPDYQRLSPHWGTLAQPWKCGKYGTAKTEVLVLKFLEFGVKVYAGQNMLVGAGQNMLDGAGQNMIGKAEQNMLVGAGQNILVGAANN